MFPTRIRHIALALGLIVLAILGLLAGRPVGFRLTDLGIAADGLRLDLVSDAHHPPAGTVFHMGGCKTFGETAICSHKDLAYDRAHGLRFTATLTTRPPTGL